MFNFENIGEKIKVLAKVLCWLGIGASCIFGLYQMVNDMFGNGVAVVIVGSLTSWISSFFIYGFGELILQSTETAKNTKLLGHILEDVDEISLKGEKIEKSFEETLNNLNENLSKISEKETKKKKRVEKETESNIVDLSAIIAGEKKEKGKKTE